MLINSVILVLREVLEAAILISVLLALSSNLQLARRWLYWALPPALIGIVSLAGALDDITDAVDGAGQELLNAGLQLSIYLFIMLLIANGRRGAVRRRQNFLCTLMALSVAFALLREGSEIYLYIGGFASAEQLRGAVYAGSAIGAGIGLSLGILLYNGLRALTDQHCYRVCLLLLIFIGAGMIMQASMLLQQADWLPAANPLWDSSTLLSEQSIAGELLYAVFGYEATPTAIQVALYGLSLAALMITAKFKQRRESPK